MKQDAKSLEAFSDSFSCHLQQGEYAGILELDPLTEFDAYLKARAHFTLGRMPSFNRMEESLSAKLSSPYLRSIFQIAKQLLGENNPEGIEEQLLQFRKAPPSHPYFQGEIYFLSAYLCGAQDQYSRAIPFYLRAADAYRAAGFAGPQSSALFNLCAAYNHLNERELFQISLEQLEVLAKENPCATVQAHSLKAKGFQLVDAGEYGAALSLLKPLAELYSSLLRHWDLGGLSSTIVFCELKLGQTERCQETIASAFAFPMSPEHSALLLEWRNLAATPFLNGNEARFLLQKWKRLPVSSPQRLNLMSVAAEKLLRAEDFSSAVKFCRAANAYSLKKQQAPGLCDFRFIETECLIRLGNLDTAEEYLKVIQNDYHPLAAEERRERLSRLSQLLIQTRGLSSSGRGPSAVSHFQIDFLNHEVFIGGTRTSLSEFPLIERFLSELVQHPGTQPIDRLFRNLYQMEYNPLRHSHRIHSLIARTRKLLRCPELICHQGGKVSINASYSVSWSPLAIGRRTAEQELRHTQILKSLRGSQRPLSISNLESAFRCTRRTLQHDLKELVEKGILHSSGNTRNRVYQLAQGVSL